MKIVGYVIIAETEGKPEQYYATDVNSGGYGYWTPHLSDAVIFTAIQKAKVVLKSDDFTKDSKCSDHIYPPRLVHSGAALSFEKPEGALTVKICPLIIGEPSRYDIETFFAQVRERKYKN
jgi:hypothetical protein